MANHHKGEVDLVVGETTFTLRYTTNVIASAEELFGRSFMDMATELGSDSPKIATLRALLWTGLQKNHPELSLEDAGDVMDDIEPGSLAAALGDALVAAFPAPEKPPGKSLKGKASRKV